MGIEPIVVGFDYECVEAGDASFMAYWFTFDGVPQDRLFIVPIEDEDDAD